MRNFQLIRTLLNAAFVTHASYLCDGSFFSQKFFLCNKHTLLVMISCSTFNQRGNQKICSFWCQGPCRSHSSNAYNWELGITCEKPWYFPPCQLPGCFPQILLCYLKFPLGFNLYIALPLWVCLLFYFLYLCFYLHLYFVSTFFFVFGSHHGFCFTVSALFASNCTFCFNQSLSCRRFSLFCFNIFKREASIHSFLLVWEKQEHCVAPQRLYMFLFVVVHSFWLLLKDRTSWKCWHKMSLNQCHR